MFFFFFFLCFFFLLFFSSITRIVIYLLENKKQKQKKKKKKKKTPNPTPIPTYRGANCLSLNQFSPAKLLSNIDGVKNYHWENSQVINLSKQNVGRS